MAEIAKTMDKSAQPLDPGGWVIVAWQNMANGDTGEVVELVQFADRSVQVAGTFGSGGTCVIQGSNDGVNFNTINDATDAPLSFLTGGLKTIMDVPRYIRPAVTAGDGTTSLTATMLFRRQVK